MIDPKESPQSTSLRELKEETGFTGHLVKTVSPPLVSDAGISNSLIHLSVVEVEGDALENKIPVPDLDDGEDIEVVEVWNIGN